MKSPEEKIVLMTPALLKAIKKALPQIRSPYVAKDLMRIALKVAKEIKLVKGLEKTK